MMDWMLFFFNDTATTEIYTLSLHDALPICRLRPVRKPQAPLLPAHLCPHVHHRGHRAHDGFPLRGARLATEGRRRSEEHTSELQSRQYLVCRLLLEKKKTIIPSLIQLPATS